MPEVRDCLLARFAELRLPVGYPATPHFLYAIELKAQRTGGVLQNIFASRFWGTDDGLWAWTTRAWYMGRAGAKAVVAPPETDAARWLYRLHRRLSERTNDIQGCVLSEVEQRGDYELLLVGGPSGLDDVVVTTSGGAAAAAPCIARAVASAGAPAAGFRLALRARIEVVVGPVTIISGLTPSAEATGSWSAPALAAVAAGDARAFGDALPAASSRVAGAWTPAPLASVGQASWRFGGSWPAWSRLVVGTGDLDAAEAQADQWARATAPCAPSERERGHRSLVVAVHADDAGVLHVDPPIHNSLGEETERCLRTQLAGQVSTPAPGFSAFWALKR